jgi:polyhydroxybutyrate depolymerase
MKSLGLGILLCGALACGSGGGGKGATAGAGGGAAAGAGGTMAGNAGNGMAGAGPGGAGGGNGGNGSGAGGGNGGAGGGNGGAGGISGGAGGNAGASGGSGGASGGGGTAGATSTGGAGGASLAVPSGGCGKSGRPANGEVAVANDHIYDFPASYDGTTPMPMVMALHANNNPNTEIQGLSNGTRLATNFVRVFPKSAGAGWNIGVDAARITTVLDDVFANYCVDTTRVFLTGHSSGAQMDVTMLCVKGGEKRFKAVAPVAASKECATLPPIPVMYIQGMMDAMRGNGNGIDVVNVFTAGNGCTTATVPDTAVPTCKSTFDGMVVMPACITYQGCTVPTVWCSHNDNGYNSTDGHEHGWPCFASNAMADFFLSLP